MSREVKADFEELQKFIRQYGLNEVLQDSNFIKTLSQMHKKHFAIMALIIELCEFQSDNNKKRLLDQQKNYLLESLSDIGNSIFLTINGAYKPARLMLRSCIETFLKGFSIDELPAIHKEKRIYQIFEKIGNLEFFCNEYHKAELGNLVMHYGQLSQDTHTASIRNMQHTSALNYFPTKSLDDVEALTRILARIITSLLFLLASKFNAEFHSIHYRNRRIIISNIKKEHRPVIMNLR